MDVDVRYSFDHPQDQEHEEEHDDNEQEEVDDEDEDDYIDMEVSSYYSNILKSSPIYQPNEFEFRTQSGPLDRNQLSTTSPADELFYKGKLLPLHLPPRLHIMETLLHNHYPSIDSICDPKEFYSTPLSTNAAGTPATGTPFLSCNVSPVESCHVSRELNPEEYFLECSNEEEALGGSGECHGSKKTSWARKLKLIKQSSSLGSKIKASRAYLKLFFGKSAGSSSIEPLSSAMAAKNKDEKGAKRSTLGQTKLPTHQSLGNETAPIKDEKVCHRRSFSGAFKLRATAKTKTLTPSSSSGSSSSVSSTTSNSNGSKNVDKVLKRSNSDKSELESAVAGAIAHCKQSHSQSQVFRSRKTFSEIGVLASQFAASGIVM